MKVNSNRDISFKSIYTNRALKKGLEIAASDTGLFAAGTTLAFSMLVRPISIWATPNTKKENKKTACAKSIVSSGTDFLLTLGLVSPVANSIERINAEPQKYLRPDTIKNLKNGSAKLVNSKAYELATQLFKIGLRSLIAIPKAVVTAAGMPFVMKYIFQENSPKKEKNNNINFKANPKGSEKIAKTVGKIINKEGTQKFAQKYKDSNFILHVISATDALTTLTFIHETNRSKKIKEENKKAVMLNAGFSTALSIFFSYIADGLTQKPLEKFIENYKKANAGQTGLSKQIKGIRNAKPIIVVGSVYYMLIPFVSTMLAEKTENVSKLDFIKKL